MRLEIVPTEFELWGTATLEGKLFKAGWDGKEDVTLVFLGTSLGWRQDHGGPEIILAPEFVFFELAHSLLGMACRGIKVTVEEGLWIRED